MKTVYLVTKKGPQAFTLEGKWLTPADGETRKKKGAKRKPRAPKADKPAAKKSGGKKKAAPSKKEEGGQATM